MSVSMPFAYSSAFILDEMLQDIKIFKDIVYCSIIVLLRDINMNDPTSWFLSMYSIIQIHQQWFLENYFVPTEKSCWY